MERAEARRLQPHYIESFFLEAFQRQSAAAPASAKTAATRVTHVPAAVRNRERMPPASRHAQCLRRYERIAFEKALAAGGNQPPAAFVCPGHPLLDAVIDNTLRKATAIS